MGINVVEECVYLFSVLAQHPRLVLCGLWDVILGSAGRRMLFFGFSTDEIGEERKGVRSRGAAGSFLRIALMRFLSTISPKSVSGRFRSILYFPIA